MVKKSCRALRSCFSSPRLLQLHRTHLEGQGSLLTAEDGKNMGKIWWYNAETNILLHILWLLSVTQVKTSTPQGPLHKSWVAPQDLQSNPQPVPCAEMTPEPRPINLASLESCRGISFPPRRKPKWTGFFPQCSYAYIHMQICVRISTYTCKYNMFACVLTCACIEL